MRKLGFTLAEVLITLGIIGVIATLTLPTLMSNTAEREYSTALKKAISSLTESVQMQVALENVSFDEMVDSGAGSNTENNSLYAFLCRRMQTEWFAASADDACKPIAEGATQQDADCLNYGNAMAEGNSAAMFFRDGSAIIFNPNATTSDCDDTFANAMTTMRGEVVNTEADMYCLNVIYDTNGYKRPNMVANCTGDKSRSFPQDTADVECTSKNFVARDQYPIRLQGVAAYPDSPSAQYMFDKK